MTVEDTGEGLDEEARRRMFDRFWRADPSRSARGSGLGLAIARQVAEAHGGSVTAERADGGGTLMRLTLLTKS